MASCLSILVTEKVSKVINSGTIGLCSLSITAPISCTQTCLMLNKVSLSNANSRSTINVGFCCTMKLKRNLICKHPNILDAGLYEGGLGKQKATYTSCTLLYPGGRLLPSTDSMEQVLPFLPRSAFIATQQAVSYAVSLVLCGGQPPLHF